MLVMGSDLTTGRKHSPNPWAARRFAPSGSMSFWFRRVSVCRLCVEHPRPTEWPTPHGPDQWVEHFLSSSMVDRRRAQEIVPGGACSVQQEIRPWSADSADPNWYDRIENAPAVTRACTGRPCCRRDPPPPLWRCERTAGRRRRPRVLPSADRTAQVPRLTRRGSGGAAVHAVGTAEPVALERVSVIACRPTGRR
jgi:hypothetical protein